MTLYISQWTDNNLMKLFEKVQLYGLQSSRVEADFACPRLILSQNYVSSDATLEMAGLEPLSTIYKERKKAESLKEIGRYFKTERNISSKL